jgi:hypothetical protein
MRAVAAPGRLIWAVSGLVTMLALAVPGFRFIVTTGDTQQGQQNVQPGNTVTRTVTVTQPVTSLIVQSYGARIQVTGGRVSHVVVTETFNVSAPSGSFIPSGPPAPPTPSGPFIPSGPSTPSAHPGSDNSAPPVAAVLHHGQLSVGSVACNSWESCVSFTVTVPRRVTVTVSSQSGPVTVSGVAAVNGDSGGASMELSDIDGPVDATTDGGPLQLTNVTGPVQADTGGGSLDASAITAATATIATDGGPAQLTGSIARLYVDTGGGSAGVTLSAAPEAVTISSDGGPAELTVPGGPYAVTAYTDGGPESVTVAASATATRSITVITGGGPLQIQP